MAQGGTKKRNRRENFVLFPTRMFLTLLGRSVARTLFFESETGAVCVPIIQAQQKLEKTTPFFLDSYRNSSTLRFFCSVLTVSSGVVHFRRFVRASEVYFSSTKYRDTPKKCFGYSSHLTELLRRAAEGGKRTKNFPSTIR